MQLFFYLQCVQSPNEIVKLKIKQLLADIGYPVYNNYVPANENGSAYVLISDVANNDDSTKVEAQTRTNVQIGVYTRQNLAQGDALCDLITRGVYQRIFPNNQTKLDLSPEFTNSGIYFVNDTPQVLQLNSFIYINRFINFRLHIYQN